MGGIVLLRPWWLLAMPVLLLLALWLLQRRSGLGGWERAVDPGLLRGMRILGRVDTGGRPVIGLSALAVAGLVALALAGPSTLRRDAAAFRNLDGVVFALDASASAVEASGWNDLLTMGRVGVDALGSRPAGLVVFAGDAYVATDMSADHRELGQTLLLVQGGTVPDPGSRPARGLDLARTMLDQAGIIAGDVILLTDGEGLGPEVTERARAIADRGARLSVVSLGDGDAAAALALAGGGRVFAPRAVDGVGAFLGDTARDRLERQDVPLPFRADHGRWLLLLALLAAAMLMRRAVRE